MPHVIYMYLVISSPLSIVSYHLLYLTGVICLPLSVFSPYPAVSYLLPLSADVGYCYQQAHIHQPLQDEDVNCPRSDADVIWCHPEYHQLYVSLLLKRCGHTSIHYVYLSLYRVCTHRSTCLEYTRTHANESFTRVAPYTIH